MNNITSFIETVFLTLVFLASSSSVVGQDIVTGKNASLDDALKSGFDFLAKGKYKEARIQFETAQAVFSKRPEASPWLFSKIHLSDENDSDATSKERRLDK